MFRFFAIASGVAVLSGSVAGLDSSSRPRDHSPQPKSTDGESDAPGPCAKDPRASCCNCAKNEAAAESTPAEENNGFLASKGAPVSRSGSSCCGRLTTTGLITAGVLAAARLAAVGGLVSPQDLPTVCGFARQFDDYAGRQMGSNFGATEKYSLTQAVCGAGMGDCCTSDSSSSSGQAADAMQVDVPQEKTKKDDDVEMVD